MKRVRWKNVSALQLKASILNLIGFPELSVESSVGSSVCLSAFFRPLFGIYAAAEMMMIYAEAETLA